MAKRRTARPLSPGQGPRKDTGQLFSSIGPGTVRINGGVEIPFREMTLERRPAMKEADWLVSTDVVAMLTVSGLETSDRKERLWALALLESVKQNPTVREQHQLTTRALESGEDGGRVAAMFIWGMCIAMPGYSDVKVAALVREVFGNPFHPLKRPRTPAQVIAARSTVVGCCSTHADNMGCDCLEQAKRDMEWFDHPLVETLARAAYEEHDPATGHLDAVRLLVLADSLEEAGCTEQAMLHHLRSPGPHVRGCHVLDCLTGKS